MIIKKKREYIGLDTLQVPVVDTSPTSYSYLRLDSVPAELTAGKNVIKILGNIDVFKKNSPILVEVLDSRGNTVYVDFPDYFDSLKRRLIVIDVDDTVAPGPGLITICTILRDDLVDPHFRGILNFKWQAQLNISPFSVNTSEIILTSPPIVELQTRIRPFVSTSYRNNEEMISREYGDYKFTDYTFGEYVGAEDDSSFIFQKEQSSKILNSFTSASITSFDRSNVFNLSYENYSARRLVTNYPVIEPDFGFYCKFDSNLINDSDFQSWISTDYIQVSSFASRDFVYKRNVNPTAGNYVYARKSCNIDANSYYLVAFDIFLSGSSQQNVDLKVYFGQPGVPASTTASFTNISNQTWYNCYCILQNQVGTDLIISNGETTSPWPALSFNFAEYIDNVRVHPLVKNSKPDFKLESDLIGGFIKVHEPIISPATGSGMSLLNNDTSYTSYINTVLKDTAAGSNDKFQLKLIKESERSGETSYAPNAHIITSFTSKPSINQTLINDTFTDTYSVAFSLNEPWYPNVLLDPIIGPNNLLYGVIFTGGQFSHGGLYSYDPNLNVFSILHYFPGAPNGRRPSSRPIWLAGGSKPGLYGTTDNGGTYDSGSIYRYNFAADQLTIVHSFGKSGSAGFKAESGAVPTGRLTQASNGLLYGTALYPTASGYGVIYSFNTQSGEYNILHRTGSYGFTTLVQSGSDLWGTTEFGGQYGYGSIFSYNIVTNTFNTKHSFNVPGPFRPVGGMVLGADNNFYGITFTSSIAGQGGSIYKYNSGSGFASLLTLDKTMSGSESERPMFEDSGYFYGTCNSGGTYNKGTIFKFNTGSNSFEVIHNLQGSPDGNGAKASFVRFGNTLYGTSTNGGTVNAGTIFRIDRTGINRPFVDREAGVIYHHNGVLPTQIPATSSLITDYPTWTGPVQLSETDLYSIVELEIKNLEPAAGDISKIKLSAKPQKLKGEFTDLGIYSTKPVDLLLDNNYVNHVHYVDSPYRLTGYFKPVISNQSASIIESAAFRTTPFLAGWNTGSITSSYYTVTDFHLGTSIKSAPENNLNVGGVLRFRLNSNPSSNGLAYAVYTQSALPPTLTSLNSFHEINYNLYSAVPMPVGMDTASINWYTSSNGFNIANLNNILVYTGLVTATSSLTVDNIYKVSPALNFNYAVTGSNPSSSTYSHPLTFNNKLGWTTDQYFISNSISVTQSLYPAIFFEYNAINQQVFNNTIDTARPHIVEISNLSVREVGDRDYIMNNYWSWYTRTSGNNNTLTSVANVTSNTDRLIDSVKLDVIDNANVTSSRAVGYLNSNRILFETVDSYKFQTNVPYVLSFNAFSEINELHGIDITDIGSFALPLNGTPGWQAVPSLSWTNDSTYKKFNFGTSKTGSLLLTDIDFYSGSYKIEVSTGMFSYSTFKNPTSLTILDMNATTHSISNIQPNTKYTFIVSCPGSTTTGPKLIFESAFLDSDANLNITGIDIRRFNYDYNANTNISSILPGSSKLRVYGINTNYGVPFADTLTSENPGELIGELEQKLEYNHTGETKNFGRVEMEFMAETDGYGKVAFESDLGADWYISDISIKPKDRVGMTPAATRLFIKLPNDLVNVPLTFKVEYLNDINTKSPYVTLLNDVVFSNKDEAYSRDKSSLNTSTVPLIENNSNTQGPNQEATGNPGDDLVV